MAAELGKLAKEFADRGYTDFSTYLLAQIPVARKMGVPESFSAADVETKKLEIEASTLKQTAINYLKNPTSDSLNNFTQAFWTKACRVEGKGRHIVVPKFPEIVKRGELHFIDPPEVSLGDLANMFPEMKVGGEGKEIVDDNNNFGLFSASMEIEAPRVETTEEKWIEQLKQEGKQPMSLKHYIIFGQMMKACIDQYPDTVNGSWSRLSSRYEDKILVVRFDPLGSLWVCPNTLPDGYSGSHFGSRVEKMIQG